MTRGDMTDTHWARLEPLFPPTHSGRRGRPWMDHRRMIDGIRWIGRTGAPWRDLPASYGPWQTCYDRFRRWQRDGTWTRILQTLQTAQDVTGTLDWHVGALDASLVKAHQHASGARHRCVPDEPADHALGRSRGGTTTKIHLVCDGAGRPLALHLTAGQVHESTQLAQLLETIRVPRTGRGRPRKRLGRIIMDKGYSYPRCRRLLRQRGIRALIPERQDQRAARQRKGRAGGRPVDFDKSGYAQRNVVERSFARFKQWRRIATRYDKLACSYLAFVTCAAIFIWLGS